MVASEDRLPRKLAAIVYADVAEYSRLTGDDEDATHRALMAHLELFAASVAEHGGRVMHYAGDALLAKFGAAVDALACAVSAQRALASRNADLPAERKVQFRVGINLGDVIEDRGEIYGDGVNIAARLESLAAPGGVCISEAVRGAVGGKLPLDYDFLGEQAVKNIREPVRAYHVRLPPQSAPPPPSQRTLPARRLLPAVIGAITLLVLVAAGTLALWAPWSSRDAPGFAGREAPARPENAVLSDQPDAPSVAVLPFANLSDDSGQEYFADGMTDDLITDLSKISGLFVIARNSSFVYKGQSRDLREVARELGVKYLLEGSVRRAGDRVRINAQLIDGGTGRHLWAERFDSTLKDVFDLQDRVSREIVTALAVRLTDADEERLGAAPRVAPDAYDMLLRGLELYQRYNPIDNAEARGLFEKAIALDAGYARAYANVAWTYASEVNFNWTDTPQESIRLGLEFAAAAADLDDSIPQIHMARSVLYLAQRRYDEALESGRRTLDVHPNIADGHATLAFVSLYAGELTQALRAIHAATRLNPRGSYIYLAIEGHVHLLMGQYADAARLLEEAVTRNPSFDRGRLVLAASYARLGRIEDAAWAVEEALSIRPGLSLAAERRNTVYRRPQDLELYIDSLREAGLPK